MQAGSVSVYLGSVVGIAAVPVRVLEGAAADDSFGISAASAGDENGDGFGDLVVGAILAAPGGRSGAGTASVFAGSAVGISMIPVRVLEGTTAGDNFGLE